jgi:hypothetical protein
MTFTTFEGSPRRLCRSAVALLLLGGGLGCNTVMNGTAPAREGYLYAVGSRNNQPTVWLCPSSKRGECQVVTVTEDER